MGIFDAFKKKVEEKAEEVNPLWAHVNNAGLEIENFQLTDANGTVTIKGKVQNGSVAAQAEEMLKAKGVGSVTNHIEIADVSSQGIKYKVATRSSNLNCRKGPGTDFEIVGKFPKDTVVGLVKRYNDTWYVVRSAEIEGYCHTDYLEAVSTS